MSYTGNQCQGLHTIILFLSFLLYFFFLYLFISLKYYIWNASSARLHFWLQKKNHLPKCELERGGGGGEGADGGGVG